MDNIQEVVQYVTVRLELEGIESFKPIIIKEGPDHKPSFRMSYVYKNVKYSTSKHSSIRKAKKELCIIIKEIMNSPKEILTLNDELLNYNLDIPSTILETLFNHDFDLRENFKIRGKLLLKSHIINQLTNEINHHSINKLVKDFNRCFDLNHHTLYNPYIQGPITSKKYNKYFVMLVGAMWYYDNDINDIGKYMSKFLVSVQVLSDG